MRITENETCILFFTKKKERKDVVEIEGKKRNLEFVKSHSTKKVKFYDFNPDTEEKHFMKEVGSILEWDLSTDKHNFSFYNSNMHHDIDNKSKKMLNVRTESTGHER